MFKLCCLFFIFYAFFVCCQTADATFYYNLEEKLNDFEKNDEAALQFVYPYIKKASQNNDAARLVTGYRNAVCFVKSPAKKLLYADSTIHSAIKSKNIDLIGIAYLGKGIVYYSSFRKYHQALEEYLKANEYAKKSNDEYLRHKIIYQLGIVKTYLGYYDDAISHFKECIRFFEKGIAGNRHPNELYNNQKGYLNSLHQLSNLYRYSQNYPKADSLINIGIYMTHQKKEFQLENAYFKKSRGILEYLDGDYNSSLISLSKSIKKLKKADDFAWLSVVYFYMGKNKQALNANDEAVTYYTKVDSIYSSKKFIFPELLTNYTELINYYKHQHQTSKQIYYLERLLKVDQKIDNELILLSSKVHKDYDRATLIEEKEMLEQKNVISKILGIILGVLAIAFLGAFIRYRKQEKIIQKKYNELQEKLKTVDKAKVENTSPSAINIIRKSTVPKEVVKDILLKLDKFESDMGYLQKGITLNKLAHKIGTNHHYLSTVINEQKQKNFSLYLSELRIAYITQQLNSDTKILHYSIEGLAEICGIGSRNNFSNLFYQYNGIKPSDFIRKRKEELRNS